MGLEKPLSYVSGVSGFTPTTVKAALDALAGARIKEMGSNSNGTYVKWENGLMVCFGTASITTAVNTAWGVLFHSGMKTFTFPAAFAATPSCSASCRTGGDYWAWVVFTLNTSATSASYVLVRPTKQDSINNSDVAWHAIGMWK